jgi:toxin ParE1/3/4
MEYKVEWSPKALQDVEAIAAYIAKDSRFYSAAVVNRMVTATNKLCAYPFRGRIVPEANQESIREIFVYDYRIIYQIRPPIVIIATVIHGSRNAMPLLEKLSEIP